MSLVIVITMTMSLASTDFPFYMTMSDMFLLTITTNPQQLTLRRREVISKTRDDTNGSVS